MTKGALPARYPIRSVSKLTGIQIDTLRAWERRYGAVTPLRDGRGRMYTDADVERLRLLRGALRRGHSIGRLASLGDAELRNLSVDTDASAKVPETPVDGAGTLPEIDTSALDVALRTLDAVGLDQEISRLAGVLRPLDLLQSALMPLLVRVGDDWHRGRVSIAQEHLISAFVRSVLGSFLRLYARPDPPARLVFATLAGDRHEIGTLGAAILAAYSGLGVTYLGADVPARDIVQSVTFADAQVAVLGVTPNPKRGVIERNLRTVVRQLVPDVELWVGGRDAERYESIITPRGMVFHDYAVYQQELIRIGGRVA
jgi:DNA-binding transcriptional MerR regulator/methylmalonyl-CoA mutase cobalamin-binding subunit